MHFGGVLYVCLYSTYATVGIYLFFAARMLAPWDNFAYVALGDGGLGFDGGTRCQLMACCYVYPCPDLTPLDGTRGRIALLALLAQLSETECGADERADVSATWAMAGPSSMAPPIPRSSPSPPTVANQFQHRDYSPPLPRIQPP